MLAAILLFVLAVVSPVLHLLTGELLLDRAYRWVTRNESPPSDPRSYFLAYYLFGLLVSLSLILFLSVVGIGLRSAAVISLLPAGFAAGRARYWLSSISMRPTVNFALWFTVILILGVSLISPVEGLRTPWRNNYGDLTWHTGMITSFVFGGNLPPQNHLFSGETLSYPFFYNLWTAMLWSFSPDLTSYTLLFCYQWMIAWTIVYYALEGDDLPLLPWAILFGGGAYLTVSRALGLHQSIDYASVGPYAHDLIGKGFPWTPFLTTIWVPQRPTVLGAAVMLVALQLFHRSLYGVHGDAEARKRDLLFAGALLGVSPLLHTHFLLAVVLYMLATLIAKIACPGKMAPTEVRREHAVLAAAFALALAPGVLFLPWIASKSGIIEVAGAWMQSATYKADGLWAALKAGAVLWTENAAQWIFATLLLLIVGKRRAAAVAVLVVFLFANFLQFAIWDWDELKIFLGLYLATIALWTTIPRASARRLHWLLLVLIFPCLAEMWISLQRYERLTVYTEEEIEWAAQVRENTEPSDVIAAAPDHNSPITLTGRRMFYGYEGTLHSHGIDYNARRNLFLDLAALPSCTAVATAPEVARDPSACPRYLYWTAREKRYWNRDLPPPSFAKTALPYLYKIIPPAPAS